MDEVSDAVLGLASSSSGGKPFETLPGGIVVSACSNTAESELPPVVRLLEVEVFQVRPE